MKQPNFKGNVNGIDYQLQMRGGRYSLRFTDPRTHQRKRVPTKSAILVGGKVFAAQYLKNYMPGETGRLTVGQLVENFLTNQQVEFPERSKKAGAAWDTRMRDKFAHFDARDLKGRDIMNYRNWCVGVKVLGWESIQTPLAKATANRDIAVLSGAYTHAREVDEFNYRPKFAKFSEKDNVREGFLEQDEFDAIERIMAEMGSEYLWLRGYVWMAYECGNRSGELKSLRVGAINFLYHTVRLKAVDTKSGTSREIGLSDEMYFLLQACCAGKRPNDFVFTRPSWSRTHGDVKMRPIGDFRKLWRDVVAKAGIERDVLIHDLRRSAVMNMVESGMAPDTIMRAIGHLTPSMLTRYNILRKQKLIEGAKLNEQRKLRERELYARQQAGQFGGPKLGQSEIEAVSDSLEVVVN